MGPIQAWLNKPVREAQRLQAERLENLNNQMKALQKQQAEKEKVLTEAYRMAENYKKQVEMLEKKQPEPQFNRVLYVVIAVLILLILLMLMEIASK